MIITGLEIFFGDSVFSHVDLCEEIGKELADKIKEKSGFAKRYITSPDKDIIDIGKIAVSSKFLNQKLCDADLIIVVSEYVQGLIPPPSSRLLEGFVSDRALIIDLNRGCSGFCEALVVANSFFSMGQFKKAVIVTADNYSKIIKRSNRSLAPIFSDAITFTCIEYEQNDRFHFNFGFDYSRIHDLEYQIDSGELYMNGAGLISFVSSKVIPKIKELLRQQVDIGKVDHFFAHQGSELVINAINQQFISYDLSADFLSADIGNINSSTIPFLIKSTLEKEAIQTNKLCILSGFGVGLSFCNVITDIKYRNDNN